MTPFHELGPQATGKQLGSNCQHVGMSSLPPFYPQPTSTSQHSVVVMGGESPITSEHISLVSLMSFHGMREMILNTLEDSEKTPTQKREVGTYLETF